MNSKKNGDTTRLQMIRFQMNQKHRFIDISLLKKKNKIKNKMKNEVIFENKRMQIFTRKTYK